MNKSAIVKGEATRKINVKGLRWRFMGMGEGISLRLGEPGKDVEGKKFQGRSKRMPGPPGPPTPPVGRDMRY